MIDWVGREGCLDASNDNDIGCTGYIIIMCFGHILMYCRSFLDGYCSTVQGLLDWFEVDLGFTELVFIQ